MPKIETKVTVSAPIDHVYKVAQDNLAFPSYMEDVQSLTIVNKQGNQVISDWVGIVPSFGLKIKWQQEDIWNDQNYTCDFHQTEGSYDSLIGQWKFTPQNNQTLFESELDYEFNVPAVGPLIKKVIFNLVQKNVKNMLEAIKLRAESTYLPS